MTKKSSPDFRAIQDENLVINIEQPIHVDNLVILKENLEKTDTT